MRPRAGLMAALLAIGPAGTLQARQSPDDDLRKQVEALRETLKQVQRDIQDLKAALASRGSRRGAETVIDVGGKPFRGRPEAPLTLVEFSDYQCPFCSNYALATYPLLETEFVTTGKLKAVFVDLPLEQIHRLAFKAAEAAACAADQGKYWEMRDRLFSNQQGLEPWTTHAQALGLDVARFEECLGRDAHALEIRKSVTEAGRLGVITTPSFMLGRSDPGSGKVRVTVTLQGARPYTVFKEEIEKLLAEAQEPRSEGPGR